MWLGLGLLPLFRPGLGVGQRASRVEPCPAWLAGLVQPEDLEEVCASLPEEEELNEPWRPLLLRSGQGGIDLDKTLGAGSPLAYDGGRANGNARHLTEVMPDPAETKLSMDSPMIFNLLGQNVAGDSPPGTPVDKLFLRNPSVLSMTPGVRSSNITIVDGGNKKVVMMEMETANSSSGFSELFNNMPVNATDGHRVVEISVQTLGNVVVDASGVMYVGDFDHGRILRVVPGNSNVEIIASAAGERGASGDCGPGTLAKFRYPRGLALIPATNGHGSSLAIADSGNNRIRQLWLTDWPSCIRRNSGCHEVKTESLVDIISGDISSDAASFSMATPDECAFTCKYFGTGTYPVRLPHVDILFTKQDLTEFFKIDFTQSEQGKRAYLSQDTLHLDPPEYFKSYPLIADFPDKQLIKGKHALMGAVMNSGNVRRLNSTEVENQFWEVWIEKRETSLPPQPTEVRLRFSVKGTFCAGWVWNGTSGASKIGGAGSGECYLRSGAGDPAAMETAASSCPATWASGDASCVPGQISTLVGTGGVGDSKDQAAPAQEKLMGRLQTRLVSPHSVVTSKGSKSSPTTLLIADTQQSRILGMPQELYNVYHVNFWMFINGTNAIDLVNAVRDADQASIIGSAISQWLVRMGGNAEEFRPVNLKKRLRSMDFFKRAFNICDPTDEHMSNQIVEVGAGFKNRLLGLCPNLFNEDTNDTESWIDDKLRCESCLNKCIDPLVIFASTVTSEEKCAQIKKVSECLQVSACVLNVSGSGQTEVTIGARLSKMWGVDMANQMCEDFQANTAFANCSDLCDRKIAKMLYSAVYPTMQSSIGMYFDISFFSRLQADRMASLLSGLQEDIHKCNHINGDTLISTSSMKESCPSLYPFLVGLAGIVHNEMGSRVSLADFRFGVMSPYGYYDGEMDGIDGFIFTETRQPGEVVTLAGTGVPGSDVGRTTSLRTPGSMAMDKADRLYVADTGNNRIVRVDNIWVQKPLSTRVAGSEKGVSGHNGDAIKADEALLDHPTDIAISEAGTLYIADNHNHVVRYVEGLTGMCPGMLSWKRLLVSPTDDELSRERVSQQRMFEEVRAIILNAIQHCRNCTLAQPCNKEFYATNCVMDMRGEQVTDQSSHVRHLLLQAPLGSDKTSPCGHAHIDCAIYSRMFLTSDSLLKISELSQRLDSDGAFAALEDEVECGYCQTDSCPQPQSLMAASNEYLVETCPGDLASCEYKCVFRPNSFFLPNAFSDPDDLDSGLAILELWALTSATALSGRALRQVSSALKVMLNRSESSPWNRTYDHATLDVLFSGIIDAGSQSLVEAGVARMQKAFCAREGTSLIRDLLLQWYVSVSYCPFEVRAYDRVSAIPSEFFSKVIQSLVIDQDSDDKCYPGCGLARLHESDVGSPWRVVCCGLDGYRCNFGEGPCHNSNDCALGLMCGKNNCLWQANQSCCTAVDDRSAALEFFQVAMGIGYSHLNVI